MKLTLIGLNLFLDFVRIIFCWTWFVGRIVEPNLSQTSQLLMAVKQKVYDSNCGNNSSRSSLLTPILSLPSVESFIHNLDHWSVNASFIILIDFKISWLAQQHEWHVKLCKKDLENVWQRFKIKAIPFENINLIIKPSDTNFIKCLTDICLYYLLKKV